MSDLVFEVVDKRGRKIHLSNERWKHITSPISPHAYMTNYLEEIKETLEGPEKIVRSLGDDNKFNYFRFYKTRKQRLKVIVRYLNESGFVITAYFVK